MKTEKGLKTLKDFEALPLETSTTAYQRLKAEAIKWVRELEATERLGVVYHFKQFFDITEEDLDDWTGDECDKHKKFYHEKEKEFIKKFTLNFLKKQLKENYH